MQEVKISDFDAEFLLSQLKQESLNADYWYQRYQKLEREIERVQHGLSEIIKGALM